MQEGLPGQAVSGSSTPYVSAPSSPGRAERLSPGHLSNSNSTSPSNSEFEFDFEFSARFSALEELPMSPMPMHASSKEAFTFTSRFNLQPSNSSNTATPNNTKNGQSLVSFYDQQNNNNNSPSQSIISPLTKVASSLKDLFYPRSSRKTSPSESPNAFPRHEFSHSISRNNEKTPKKPSSPFNGKQSLARSSSTGYGHSNSSSSSSSISLHYATQRAHAEEMRKKTYLPYRQGILGCLGFQSRSCNKSTVPTLSRTIRHVPSSSSHPRPLFP